MDANISKFITFMERVLLHKKEDKMDNKDKIEEKLIKNYRIKMEIHRDDTDPSLLTCVSNAIELVFGLYLVYLDSISTIKQSITEYSVAKDCATIEFDIENVAKDSKINELVTTNRILDEVLSYENVYSYISKYIDIYEIK